MIIPLASIRKYKKVIKINLTTALNSEILLSLMHRYTNGVQVAVTPATPQLANEYKMHSPRPIKVKYHVVDVHMTPLEE